ncbi:hypothetical protein HPB50_008461 [Hyalomma asiaticum]|uniref:Uncharacterized protein n=1 Tax=Hyalomma asiaticum TaxID=266040 RepID=A0ACB7SKN7_HYAAI|nr:hypothetical protein HPB50_008461 [Hyalomma asiaticum]
MVESHYTMTDTTLIRTAPAFFNTATNYFFYHQHVFVSVGGYALWNGVWKPNTRVSARDNYGGHLAEEVQVPNTGTMVAVIKFYATGCAFYDANDTSKMPIISGTRTRAELNNLFIKPDPESIVEFKFVTRDGQGIMNDGISCTAMEEHDHFDSYHCNTLHTRQQRRRRRRSSRRQSSSFQENRQTDPSSQAHQTHVSSTPKTDVGKGKSGRPLSTTEWPPLSPLQPAAELPQRSPTVQHSVASEKSQNTDKQVIALLRPLINAIRVLLSNVHTPSARSALQVLDALSPVLAALE